jgi:Kef-type K+ transport system membrane component KefB
LTSSIIFLLQVFVVVVVPFAVLRVTRLKGLVPRVVIQILVGIALGPSLFGQLAPGYYQMFFNKEVLSQLSGIASVAVLFFGLITGLHLEPATFRGNGRAFLILSVASVVVSTGLGFLAGLWIALYRPGELGANGTPIQFAEAIGICTGITALPVLGAILHEMGLLGRRIGNLALGIAGVNNGVLWILLSLLLTEVAGQEPGGFGLLITILVLPAYMAVMVTMVRPLLRRMITARIKNGEMNESGLALVCAATIGSALVTQTLGLHYILGAFVAGVIMPTELRKAILDRVQMMTLVLLMPFFFLLTGLRTLVDLNSSILLQVFLIAAAIAIVGTALAGRFAGESWPNALGLGALLQTKGLMEVIVLTILLDGGIISINVFSALILMAVVSTAVAMPLTRLMLAQEAKKLTGKF